jgi:ankyrin repeat protein
LLWAAPKGHERVVELLLQKGVDPDSKDKFGQSPLLWAAANGHEAVVQLLLASDKFDPNSVDAHAGYGQKPLAWAAKNGHAAVVSNQEQLYIVSRTYFY